MTVPDWVLLLLFLLLSSPVLFLLIIYFYHFKTALFANFTPFFHVFYNYYLKIYFPKHNLDEEVLKEIWDSYRPLKYSRCSYNWAPLEKYPMPATTSSILKFSNLLAAPLFSVILSNVNNTCNIPLFSCRTPPFHYHSFVFQIHFHSQIHFHILILSVLSPVKWSLPLLDTPSFLSFLFHYSAVPPFKSNEFNIKRFSLLFQLTNPIFRNYIYTF